MKYTKRQKEAIDDLHKLMFLLDDVYSTGLVEDEERDKYVKSIYLILDLLDSQQKEIQKLKNKNKKYYDGKLFTANQIKAIEKERNKNFIPKDKIKEKIKELEKRIEEENSMLELNQICKEDYESRVKYLNYALNIYKRLLGDE